MSTVPTISRDEIAAKLDAGDDFVIVEALGPMYFDDAHLPGARNLPHDRVDELAATVIPSTDTFVVVYCANTPCPNSLIASRRLIELGYTNVHEYVEGKEDCIEAGLPIEGAAALAS
jgi:rhodanese-related sulfurtransferase